METPVSRINGGYPDSSPELQGPVRDLQRELVRWGFHIMPDGRFGASTRGTGSGALTARGSSSAKRSDGLTFQRQRDLFDPTPLVNQWKNNLPVD